ncbi:hypothetical protein [Streptomyces sp. NPDC046805]|uniref:hypothetical protein n=1 Tax=Streptomyces sp. NPDC046805 TaxID=3155134 RepID=UPI0033C4FAD3
MSVSRTAVRLIATFVASGALVGAAALPALAAGHDGDNGRSYSHSSWGDDDDRDGRFGDWDRGWHRDRDRDWDRGWHRGWPRNHGWHHGWYGHRHWDRGWHGHR